jgi:hypothetical protein
MSPPGIDRLELYNAFYNDYCSAMPHGMVVSMEELQAVSLESMILALTSGVETKNRKNIKVSDIADLARRLRSQGDDAVAKHK